MGSSQRAGRILLLAFSIAFLPLTGQAVQSVWSAAQGGRLQKRGAAPVAQPSSDALKPQLLNGDSDPTLRYPVAVNDGGAISCGWLDVTRSEANYAPNEQETPSAKPAAKKFASLGTSNYVTAAMPSDNAKLSAQGFRFRLSELKIVQFDKGALAIQTATVKVELTYVPEDLWRTAQTRRTFFLLAEQYLAGTTSIQTALRDFDTVLAMVKPPTLDVGLRAEPASVEKGHPVRLAWTSANATSLDLEPGIGQVAASGQISATPQESTNYTLTARGPAGTKASTVLVTVTAPVIVPTLVLTEPSAADGQTVEVVGTSLIIRGVVMDASGIPVVTVNGKSVTMRPTSAQAAQFTSDPLILQPGENRLEVLASNSTHGQAKVAFVARCTPPAPKVSPVAPSNPKGLAKADILTLLQGDVPSARLADLVKSRGLKFVPTPDDLKEIRAAGGGDDLIEAMAQSVRD
jgi:hypothetical protein